MYPIIYWGKSDRLLGGVTSIGKIGISAARASIIKDGKIGYLFGRATGNQHSIDRANGNALQMKRLGVHDTSYGHSLLVDHLDAVAQTSNNISRRYSNQFGNYEVRDSLFIGPSGKAAKFESTWEVMKDGSRRLTTVIPFGG